MRFRALHPDMGVVVEDFDLQSEPGEPQLRLLRSAYEQHHMLLFRPGRALPPERQVTIAGWFGELLAAGDDGSYSTLMSNDSAIGEAPLRFHSDLTFTDSPFDAICLHALELPPQGTTTSFASGVASWARLAPETQRQLAGKTVRHRLPATQEFGDDWPDFCADQPLCLPHPRSGQPVLFVTEEHAERIHGLPAGESARVLDALFAELYAPAHVYEHQWQPYDLLLWDNLALQHARTRRASPEAGARVLQRVMLGRKTFQEALASQRVHPM